MKPILVYECPYQVCDGSLEKEHNFCNYLRKLEFRNELEAKCINH